MPCPKGHLLFRQGEPSKGLYILKSGRASLVMADESGAEVMQLIIGPGSILGVPAVVTKEPYTLSAKALVGSEVGFVELSDFEDLMRTQPALFPLVLAVLASEVRASRIALTAKFAELSRRPSRGLHSAPVQ